MKNYTELQREMSRVLRQHEQTRTYTKSHFSAWCALADALYPDTHNCVNADLRLAFVRGCIYGYEFVLVFNAPHGYDRLQQDAFMDGVKHGEDAWSDAHADED